MKYKVALLQSEEGFSVWVPSLPGCCSQGETEEEALTNIEIAICEYLEVVSEQVDGAILREIEVAI
jgi:predicted RNase H-like HicB family nuclease